MLLSRISCDRSKQVSFSKNIIVPEIPCWSCEHRERDFFISVCQLNYILQAHLSKYTPYSYLLFS